MLTVELSCNHPPHKCRCRHNVQTEVSREDLTSSLIKSNPALLKYLGKRKPLQTQNIPIGFKDPILTPQTNQIINPNQPYRSIVEQKGLNFCLDQEQPDNKHRKDLRDVPEQCQPKQLEIQDIPHEEIKQKMGAYDGDRRIKKKVDHKQKELHGYHKGLKNQSRYLSDTAFRKYFNRQCFENYGRQNISNKADGFAYGNYMKTFNINPHTGENMPINEETFYHALVTGSPQKYGAYTQEVRLGLTQNLKNSGTAVKERSGTLEKSKLDVEKLLVDNQKQSKLQNKYQNLHLKPKQKTTKFVQQTQSNNRYNSPSHLQINTRQNIGQDNNQVSRAQPQRSNSNINCLYMKPNTNSVMVEQEVLPAKQQSSKISIKQTLKQINCNSPKSIHYKPQASPKINPCEHKQNQQTIDCGCCLNRMKKMILQLTEKDPDLAQRIMSSAQKKVMYKNYALNNYDNAPMNPQNLKEDGSLNIYEG